ncbi:MAG TPA: ribonuclease P protein component [Bacteroidetes bacterium]|nr:ribonuclease P protein component [Bacteroidota bacterium]
MKKFTFKKAERLKSRKVIGRMFKDGKSFGVYPLRLVWLEMEERKSKSPVQFTVSVPKRSFKSAVKRNRLKRKVREAWRLNKNWLYEKLENTDSQIAFMVIYTAKEDLPFEQIEAAMRTINRRFFKKNILRKTNHKRAKKPLL